jgi:ethanolaminephosphotransferase
MTAAYLYLQPVILRQHLVPYCFYLGLVNAYSVGKIIIAHLTKNPKFPYTNSLIWPLTIGVVDSLGPFLGLWPSVFGDGMYQVSYMFACLGLGVGVYGCFVVSRLRRREK